MSFNEIQLPGVIISEIYKRSLVHIPGMSTQEKANSRLPVAAAMHTDYLGQNLKNVLILVDYPTEVYLPAQELDFLVNILKACQLNLQDIAIVNTCRQTGDFNDIVRELTPKCILQFGINSPFSPRLSGLGHFLITRIDQIPMINVPGLEKLNQRTEESHGLKRKLWENLKELFNV